LSARLRGAQSISASLRVEYTIDDRPNISFTSSLSRRGMSLRSAPVVPPDPPTRFTLKLDDGGEPLVIVGRGSEDAAGQLPVVFEPGQADAMARLDGYFATQVLPKLERACDTRRPDGDKLLTLATFYLDMGRAEDAWALWRRGLEAGLSHVGVYEALA